MARIADTLSLALVATLYVVFSASTPVSADLESRSVHSSPQRHHHMAKRTFSPPSAKDDCPEGQGKLTPLLQDQVAQLESASAQQGGKQQVKEVDLLGPGGSQHVQIKAKSSSGANGSQWSYSWTSSQERSSSSSSSSSSSTSSNSLNSSNASSDASTNESIQNQQQQQQQQQVVSHTEMHTSNSHHSSSSHRTSSRITTDSHGHVKSENSSSDILSSVSSSTLNLFSNVFKYIISSNTEKSENHSPFQNAQVQWTKSPLLSALEAVVHAPTGHHIVRPAKAEVCNRRFPFNNEQYISDGNDERFSIPYPKEALDPVSKVALDLHNTERVRYGLEPLQWSAELANMAACWADLKAYGHSEDHFCASGENIAVGMGDPCYSNPMEGMKNAILSFLDEDRNWARNPHFDESNGHWTQAVWKDTRYVGCAVAQRKDFFMQGYTPNDQNSMYLVCEYYPPGNYLDQFDKQVPRVRPMPQLRSQCSANEKHGS